MIVLDKRVFFQSKFMNYGEVDLMAELNVACATTPQTCDVPRFHSLKQKKRKFAGDNLTISWVYEANDIH